MEYTDPKKRKIKEIGSSYAVIFNKKKAIDKGFNKDDLIELVIKKEKEDVK